ncbi:unnamed protein product [Moneuplotes crassus]|uniref:Uncharacterized protein n=1 Tax=Euplotes crassus TaxID=5936 RepID=A0AAD2CWK7_EUPCR|nr:unnamed protein product [Moneuplotes crassus]
MKLSYEKEESKNFYARGSSKPLYATKINLPHSKFSRNQKNQPNLGDSNSVVIDSSKAFPLQIKRIQHKLRNFSKEKLQKMGKINLPKNGFKLKLKKDGNIPCKLFDRSESLENNRRNSDSASIFNITFGNFKITPKQQTNNVPLFCKGKNFNSEGILPPNFALEDVFLKGLCRKHLGNKESNGTKCSRNNQQYVRYFHTSDGARKHNNPNPNPYRDSQPYLQQDVSMNSQNSLQMYRSHLENSTINSEVRARSCPEEDSPFFIKRRIRSSNPHSRVKRKVHPVISKHFFKKQMSRHGNRNKLLIQEDGESSSEKLQSKAARIKNICNTDSKDQKKAGKLPNNLYLGDNKAKLDTFSNYCYIDDPKQPSAKDYIS